MDQMKEQNKTPEKELSKMEIANLSDAEFNTLVIKILKELTQYSNNIKEEEKVTQSEIKNNPQEISKEGKEARIQTNDLEHKEEINIQPEQQEGRGVNGSHTNLLPEPIWNYNKIMAKSSGTNN